MKYLTLLLVFLTGCGTPLLNPDSPTALDLAFNFGTKMVVYKGVQQNPELVDLGNAIADILEGKGGEVVQSELLDYIKDTLVPKYIEHGADQVIAREIVDSFYLLFKQRIDELAAQARLPVLAQNIRAGISYATLNPDQDGQ